MVSFEIDNYINEKDAPHIFVDLSDGTRVFGDDDRPGLDETKFWKRLKQYLYEKNLYIESLWIRFRSNAQKIGSSKYGYMFRRGIMANISDGENFSRFIIGFIDENNKIQTQTWQVPELIKMDSESDERDIEGHEEQIIWNSPVGLDKYAHHNISLLN